MNDFFKSFSADWYPIFDTYCLLSPFKRDLVLRHVIAWFSYGSMINHLFHFSRDTKGGSED